MIYLLFPGRHLVNTRFQERYLQRILNSAPNELPGFIPGAAVLTEAPGEILFAITSSNQENSRFNPVPFYIRAVGVDRLGRGLTGSPSVRFRIFGIPHYGHTENFAAFTIKEIAHQSEKGILLTPANCLVLCSTPEVIRLYSRLGYAVAPAEAAEPDPKPVTPIEIVREIGLLGEAWRSGRRVEAELASSHQRLFEDFPEVPKRIARIYQDPLTTLEGGVTETRNYSTYARGMNEIIRLKYQDIRNGIKPGRIVDEGCADGALLAEISRDFPDSDLFGIDLSAEFAGRFQERQRAGEFGGAYVHFFHRNLLDRIFEPDSIDTTLCNSTLHELWSYGQGEKSVRGYLTEKFRQLTPGGRLIIRDVVGPDNGDQEVEMWCNDTDGLNLTPQELADHSDRESVWLQQLSTQCRFYLFSRDFLRGQQPFPFTEATSGGRKLFRLTLRRASEFLSKKDYTDNWKSEMNEAFCFWSFANWKSVLSGIGFRIRENQAHPAEGSRSYTSPWVVANRYAGRVELKDGFGNPIPWPPTNMVMIAEKPGD